MDELVLLDKEVVESLKSAAAAVSKNAYAPYSRFAVGAAILSIDGRIFTGCNVENVSYGLTICAEKAAICQMIASGERLVRAVLVYTPTEVPTLPCGGCRQVIAAFGSQVDIYCVCDNSNMIHETIESLLPHAFDSLPQTGNE